MRAAAEVRAARLPQGASRTAQFARTLREASSGLPEADTALARAAARSLLGADCEDPAEGRGRADSAGRWHPGREDGPRHLTVSCLAVSPDLSALVLVDHPGSGQLRQPGGHIENGDADLRGAALRELAEECGAQAAASAEVPPVPLAVRVFRVGTQRCAEHLDVLYAAVLPESAPLAGEGRAVRVRASQLPARTAPDLLTGAEALLRRLRTLRAPSIE